ncbi:malolactic enzyme [Enterococcus raffinosus]|uniref:Malolactic enzyme n=1 Tax=Enterococcus raffinosus TaxID=71452 RepID=A0AAW8T9S7_9ENTE|nr:malolactic enzyme [Enterococcus raffinosus]MDT2524189.1 malolactic enzyme [Enterococcus raffinosus]MDT2531641.1 malolactic enzyme [Enterococcus raffinosus]MDT2535073.1 malolactic enzyme [Enterococcus raffinosus]MDT2545094.1 malolactic enzyme [Enterococcus raffinosus]MDT2554806.1 malolactic enzyme [Enterococcus raffinosus]
MLKGLNLLNNPFLNKGTAFTKEERTKYGITGMLPSTVQTLEQQSVQAYGQYLSKPSDLEKRIFLMNIFNTNRTLFYKLMGQHLVEFMPIVYDPVVADSIEQYNEIFVEPQDAAFLSIDDPENIKDSLKNAADGRDIRLIVVTDAEGILGMGDWGVNGVDIAIGKLMVYTAAAGINPAQVLPVSIDAGTNNETLLNNPLYLGNRHARVEGDTYYDFIDQFVEAATDLFPELLLHWEDFGRGNAANILEKYQDKITTFNDDIQGTGIVVLAGVLGGLNISGEALKDQTILTFGAGTAGVGIANILLKEMVRQGTPEEEARKHFYQVDKQGLLFEDTEGLTPGQIPFARKRAEFTNSEALTNLEAVVKEIHPTIMIGTSTQPGAFSEAIIKDMAAHTARPIIMPLSNPTKLAEATAKDLIEWTDGKALIGTGIPADDVEYNGVTYQIGQANNALMYPGLGLGLIASTSTRVNDEIISQASRALGGIVDVTKPGASILPPVAKITEFSQIIAETVAKSVVDQQLNREEITDVKAAVEAAKWVPEYQN